MNSDPAESRPEYRPDLLPAALLEGAEAPDFTLKTPDGSDFTLSSLRGRYVLLDFWGTWCHWCVEGMPKVKEVADRYGDKLSVVSVDCFDDESTWCRGPCFFFKGDYFSIGKY